MIPMSELVKDPFYKQFLQTKPYLPPHLSNPEWMKSPPWVVYVQKTAEGPWGKKSFWTYKKAFKFFKAWMKRGCHDITINCKAVGYEPPMRLVRIRGKYVVGSDGVKRQATKRVPWKLPAAMQLDQPQHHWCMYCRRPTVFKYYSKHKRLGAVDPSVPRCCICGASSRVALHPSDKLFRVH